VKEERAKQSLEFIKKERDKLVQYRISRSGIPEQYFDFKWSDYKTDMDFSRFISDEDIISSRSLAKSICASYAKDIEIASKSGRSLLIIGKRSSGKSVLATLILRTAIESLIGSVFYVPFARFAMEANTASLNTEREIFEEKYIEPLFLCIDEVDDMDSTSKIKNYFGNILIQRQDERKPTIITSKISLLKIKEIYGSLVYSSITNEQFFLNPITIKTEELDNSETVWIDSGRRYSIDTIIRALQEIKNINEKKRKTDGRINVDLIFSDKLQEIILSSDKMGSVDGKYK